MNKTTTTFVVLVFLALSQTIAVAADFETENFSFWKNKYGQTIFIGEIINNSGKAYTLAIFQLALFDNNDKLLDVHQIGISDFFPGQRRAFKIAVSRIYPDKLKYRLDFDGGIPYIEAQEKKIKPIVYKDER